MRHGIVEGEPGIFPDPIARILRAIGGLFRRRKPHDTQPPPNEPGAAPSKEPDSPTP